MSIGIYSKTIFSNFLPLFFSIAKTLELNGYDVYFINPNLIQKYQLKKYGLKYISGKEEKIIKLYKIEKLLLWNGSLNNLEIKGVKNYYFENGYFGNDLQIFNNGVNAKSEICNLQYKDFINLKKKIKIKINKVKLINTIKFNLFNYYVLGFFSNNPFSSFKYYINILKSKLENYKRIKILNKEKEIILNDGKYVLIGFQVHDDTQILYNSPLIKKMDDILDFFYDDIKEILPGYKIIIKEHPMDLGRIDYSSLKKKYNDTIWIKKGDISNYIDKSDYVICVNSSIGLQALSRYKKVITLGNNFYSNNPWVKNIKNKNDFKKKLLELKNQNVEKDKKEIDNYINIFKNEVFISSGGWRDFNENTIKDICERIIN